MALPLVELYINNQKVYFETEPNIAITFSHTDLHNPTVVKNSYTKTVTIEGTPENNRIFNSFYDMRRINDGELFNPSRKETFTLYKNGEPMETGYVKLDRVNRNGGKITYDVTLYGGLGQFLYNLQYNESGEQLKLSDLEYDVDLNFIVNRDTVYDAWRYINDVKKDVDNADIYEFINFAPCYNGIPNDFASDKIAIDIESFRLNNPRLYEQFKSKESDGVTVDGWISAELAKEYDEWQTKDLRSYLQRPVVRFKNIIEACCKPENNGGYVVDLDGDFFNANNPYYENAWMTLPMVKQMEKTDENVFVIKGDTFELPNETEGYVRLSMDATFMADVDSTSDVLYTGIRRVVKSIETFLYNKAYTLQLVVYKADGTVVATSPCNVFYTDILNASAFDIKPSVDTTLNNITGHFVRQENGNYVFNGASYNLVTNTFLYEDGMYGKLLVNDYTLNLKGGLTGDLLFSDKHLEYFDSVTSFGFNNETIETKGEMGYYLTKKRLLNTEKTPCNYFLTYIKQFNLHIWKDRYENKIYVRQRKNYFTGDIVDIDDRIDNDNNIIITPLNFDTKWLELSNELIETDIAEKYKQEFGVEYGVQRIDTNYNFDTNSKVLIDNNAFRSTVQLRRKSKYNIDIYQSYEDDDVYYPPFMLDGIQPFFYKSDGNTVEGEYINPKTSQQAINWWNIKYYDFLPKPLFADDKNEGKEGENVLLFYNGKVMCDDISGKNLDFCLSDDIPEFNELNEGQPCWIWSMDWDVVRAKISYLPHFSRYITNENGWVTYSWDYGTPRTIYMPDLSIDNSSNIYTKYWKPFLQDQYNSNTRRVECYVLLNEIMLEEWLKSFYYFDGRYWMLNKVTDYNPLSYGTTKCEFLSINDTSNYLT